MNNEAQHKLYTNLTKKVDGFTMSEDDFNSMMESEENRRKLHSNLQKRVDGFTMDYDAFNNTLGYDIPQEEPEVEVQEELQDASAVANETKQNVLSLEANAEIEQENNALKEALDILKSPEYIGRTTPDSIQRMIDNSNAKVESIKNQYLLANPNPMPIQNNEDFVNRLGIKQTEKPKEPTKEQLQNIRDEYAQDVNERRYDHEDSYAKDLGEGLMAGLGSVAQLPYKAIGAFEDWGTGILNKATFGLIKPSNGNGVGRKFADEVLGGNWFKERTEHYKKEADRYKDDKGAFESAFEGDWKKTIGKLGLGVAENTPNLIASIALTMAGQPELAASTLSAGAAFDKWEEIQNDENLTDEQKAVAVLGTFLAEYVFELAGDVRYQKMLSQQGKAEVKKAIAKGANSAWNRLMSSKTVQGLGKAWNWLMKRGGESITEMATEAAEQGLDIYLGLRDDFDWKAVGDAGAVAALSDAPIQTFGGIRNTYGKRKIRKEIESDATMKGIADKHGLTPEQIADIATRSMHGEEITEQENNAFNSYLEEASRVQNGRRNMLELMQKADIHEENGEYKNGQLIFLEAIKELGLDEQNVKDILGNNYESAKDKDGNIVWSIGRSDEDAAIIRDITLKMEKIQKEMDDKKVTKEELIAKNILEQELEGQRQQAVQPVAQPESQPEQQAETPEPEGQKEAQQEQELTVVDGIKEYNIDIDGKQVGVTISGHIVYNPNGSINLEQSKVAMLRGGNAVKKAEQKVELINNLNEKLIAEKAEREAAAAVEEEQHEEAAAIKQEADNALDVAYNEAIEKESKSKSSPFSEWQPIHHFAYWMKTGGQDVAVQGALDAIKDIEESIKELQSENSKVKGANRTSMLIKLNSQIKQWQNIINTYAPGALEAAKQPAAPVQTRGAAPVVEGETPVEPETPEQPVTAGQPVAAEPVAAEPEAVEPTPAEPVIETPNPAAAPEAPVAETPVEKEPETPVSAYAGVNVLDDDIVVAQTGKGGYFLARESKDGSLTPLKATNGKLTKVSKNILYVGDRPYILMSSQAPEQYKSGHNGLNKNGKINAVDVETGEEVELNREDVSYDAIDSKGKISRVKLWNNPEEKRKKFNLLRDTAKTLDDILDYVVYGFTRADGKRSELTLRDVLRYSSLTEESGKRAAKDGKYSEMIDRIMLDSGKDPMDDMERKFIESELQTELENTIRVWNSMKGVAKEDKIDTASTIKSTKTGRSRRDTDSARKLIGKWVNLVQTMNERDNDNYFAKDHVAKPRVESAQPVQTTPSGKRKATPEDIQRLTELIQAGKKAQEEEDYERMVEINDELKRIGEEVEYQIGDVETNIEAGKRVVEFLKKAGIKIDTISEDEVESILSDEDYQKLQDKKGVLYGFVKKGQIYVIAERMNPNTPVHEYTHLWVAAYAQENPAEWKRIVDILKQDSAWQSVISNENYANIRDNEQEVASEVMSRLMGEYWSQKDESGRTRIENTLDEQVKRSKIRTALRKFGKWVAKVLGREVSYKGRNFEQELSDILNMPMAQLLNIENSEKKSSKNLDNSEKSRTFAAINITQNASGRLGEQDKRDYKAYNKAREVLANPESTPEEQAEAQKILDEIYERKQQQAERICEAVIETLGEDNDSHISIRRGAGSWLGSGEYTFIFDVEAATDAERLKMMDALTYAAEEMSQDMFIESEEMTEEECTEEGLLNGEHVPNLVFEFDSPLTETEKSRLIAAISNLSTEELPLDCTVTDNNITFAFPSYLLKYDEEDDVKTRIKKYREFHDKWHNKLKNILSNGDIKRLYPSSKSETFRRTWAHSADNNEGTTRSYSQDRDTIRERANGTKDARVLSEAEGEKLRHAVRGILGLEQSTEYAIESELTSEEQSIKDAAIANGTFMQAPNGQPTKLTEKQWLQVRTEAFKNWFGDWENDPANASKVLDENGEPLVVYRGSKNANSYTFHSGGSVGFWFTPNYEVAKVYISQTAGREEEIAKMSPEEIQSRIQPCFLNIRNMETFDAEGRAWNNLFGETKYQVFNNDDATFEVFDTEEEASEYAQSLGQAADDYFPWNGSTDEVFLQRKQEGVDGMLFENVIDGGDIPSNVYVTAKNTQAKSATINNGEFDQENPDIRFQIEDTEEGVEYHIGTPNTDPYQIDAEVEKTREDEYNKVIRSDNTPIKKLPEQMDGVAKAITVLCDSAHGVLLLQAKINKWRKEHGLAPIKESMDVRNILDRVTSAANGQVELFEATQWKKLKDIIFAMEKKVERQMEKGGKLAMFAEDQLREEDGSHYEPTAIDFIERYLIARDNIERSEHGIKMRGATEFIQRMPNIPNHPQSQGKDAFDGYVNIFHSMFSEKEINDLWKAIRACTDISIEALHNGQIITTEDYERYKSRRFYIPEKGFLESEVNEENKLGRNNYQYRSKRVNATAVAHKAEGGDSMAVDVLNYIFMDTQNSITSAEKNKARLAMYNLLNDNVEFCAEYNMNIPKQVWYVYNEDTKQYELTTEKPDDATFAMQHMLEKAVKEKQKEYKNEKIKANRDIILQDIADLQSEMPIAPNTKQLHRSQAHENEEKVYCYVNGQLHEMHFVNQVQIAHALNFQRYDDSKQQNLYHKFSGAISAMLTTYNPSFAAVNVARDIPFILTKGYIQYGPKFAVKFSHNLLRGGAVWHTIGTYLRGNLDVTTPEGLALRNFIAHGGSTGYTTMRESKEFRNLLARLGNGVSQGAAFLKYASEFSELLTRFSAYKAVLDLGYSEHEALTAAKNLSVNFNRRGYGAPGVSMFMNMSMFANAAVQGATGFYRSFADTATGRTHIARTVASFILLPMLGGFLDAMYFVPDDDDDEYRESEWVRSNYILLGKGWRIPLNEQIKPFWVIGVNIAQYMRGRHTASESIASSVNSIVSNILPAAPIINNALSQIVQAASGLGDFTVAEIAEGLFVPQALASVTDMANNRTYFGGKLRYDYGDMPEYLNGENTQTIYRAIAKAFYQGNPDVPSKLLYDEETGTYTRMRKAWDVNPKEVAAFMGLFPKTLSNAISFVLDGANVIKSGIKGEKSEKTIGDIFLEDTFLNRFYKKPDKTTYRYGIYKEMRDIAKMFDEAESNYEKQEEGGNEKASEALVELQYNALNLEYYKDAWHDAMDFYNEVNTYQMAKDMGMTERQLKERFPDIPYGAYDDAAKKATANMLSLLNAYKISVEDAKNSKRK